MLSRNPITISLEQENGSETLSKSGKSAQKIHRKTARGIESLEKGHEKACQK